MGILIDKFYNNNYTILNRLSMRKIFLSRLVIGEESENMRNGMM